MKVFMLGWEFPPMISGGLGVACYGLAKALNSMGIDVMFLLPKPAQSRSNGKSSVKKMKELNAPTAARVQEILERAAHGRPQPVAAPQPPVAAAPAAQPPHTPAATAEDQERPLQRVTFVPMDVALQPYMTPAQYYRMVVEDIARDVPKGTTAAWTGRAAQAGAQGPVVQPPNRPAEQELPAAAQQRDYIEEPADASRVMGPADSTYAGDLFAETERYARLALAVAQGETFSVIHAHDWMTFEAAMAVAAATRKPLVVQIHSTELDRAGAQANRRIMEVERKGMAAADRIIAVSYKTRTQLIEKYGIDPRKIDVVYNATDAAPAPAPQPLRKKQKTVLFLGRLTEQKGPDYFLHAAKKVAAVEADVRFVIAGKGDMLPALKDLATSLGIRNKVVFTGFLKKDPVEKAFRAADVYVMPSLSEPFGITPLEALAHDVPVIISKQSGVAEVLKHVLKVDFWDTDDLANKIIAVLRHPPLAETLRQRGHDEVRQLSWDESAKRIVDMYKGLLRSVAI